MEEELLHGVNNYGDLIFDDQGYYRSDPILINKLTLSCTHQNGTSLCDQESIIDNIENRYRANNLHTSTNDPDFEALRPKFAWLPVGQKH
jgi:hypothetical protein